MKKFFVVLLLIFIAQGAKAAESYTLKIQPGPEEGKDTYYGIGSVGGQDGRPDHDHLRIGGWGDEWLSFVEFSLHEIPDNAVVQNAALGLYNFTDKNPNEGKAYLVTEEWVESEVSISWQPSYVDLGMEYVKVIGYDWWLMDVTDYVRGWVEESVENNGLMLQGRYTNNNHVRQFYSSDYLDDPSLRPYLEITYTLPEEEEEVDPLILQYAPKLAVHPDEDYLPMDVIDFVEASALWDMDGTDNQLHDAEALTYEQFEDVVGGDDTSEYYLAFSDPNKKKSIDLAAAKAKYDALASPTTVYYHKMNDGDYIVLQYWYFYAMNNWKEHGGFNNHEGDWESVFVYLDKDTQEPVHVAYSAHHNDGNPSRNALQYDSVRRSWKSNEVEKDGDTVTSFVALGSHANYPNNGDGTHDAGVKDDETSSTGATLLTADFLAGSAIAASTPFWMDYEGKWGADQQSVLGGDGPQGPAFSDVSGHERFLSPVAWAGIDKIEEVIADGTQREFNFPKAGVLMRFLQALTSGERVTVDPHDEWISFGELGRGVTLLPKFWDITSTLINGQFDAEVTFSYDPELVEQLGGSQHTLSAFYYDEARKHWEQQRSRVDVENRTVSFNADHFSRYALGFVDEEVYQENLFDQLIEAINTSSASSVMKGYLERRVLLAERLAEKGRRGTKIAARRLIGSISFSVDRLVRFGKMGEDDAEEIKNLVGEVKEVL